MSIFEDTIGIVLGAGQGKRMNSSIPKIAHLLCDKPLVIWVIESLVQAGIKKIVLVISPNHEEQIKKIIQEAALDPSLQVQFAHQNVPLGTGHAVHCGINGIQSLENRDKFHVLIAYGDTPAIQSKTFKEFLQFHEHESNSFTVLAFRAQNPFGYGRVILDEQGKFLAIREEKDCNEQEKKLNLCNSGLLCANLKELELLLPQLQNTNSAGEYYLTDVSMLARKYGYKVGVMLGEHEDEFLGVNSQDQLVELEKNFKQKIYSKDEVK